MSITVRQLVNAILSQCNSLNDVVEVVIEPRTTGESPESFEIDAESIVQTKEGKDCVELRV